MDLPDRMKTFFPDFKTAIILVQDWQTKDQAWHWHIKKHPESKKADIIIFHFISQKASFPDSRGVFEERNLASDGREETR